MSHYDDDALFRYAEGTSPIAGEIEAHLACCDGCANELASHREIVTALQSSDTWEPAPPTLVPRRFTTDVVAFAERVRNEDSLADHLCEEILTGPSAWWPNKLRKSQGAYTAGMVRQLLERMRRFLAASPANALTVTTLAIEIANDLDVIAYPCDFVLKLRAQALRDHAYVLSYMGRHPEALRVADQAESLFKQVPLPEFDLARLDLVKAAIYQNVDRTAESIVLAHQAAETFQRFGDQPRFLNARVSEAGYLYYAGRIDDALALWESIQHDPQLEQESRVYVVSNIAACYRQLGRFAEAINHLQSASEQLEMMGLTAERTRSRWQLGQVLVAAGRPQDAIPVLQQTWREFDALDIAGDAALVALELAEALLIVGRNEEVPAICRDLVARFSRAGMASRAMNALSFLREAVALGQARPSLIRHVYDFLRELPAERPRLFAPSPAGLDE